MRTFFSLSAGVRVRSFSFASSFTVSFLAWWAVFIPSAPGMPYPFTVFTRMTVGCPLCSTAALYAAYTLSGSCPPRFSVARSASDRCSTSDLSSGVLKKCSRTNAPPLATYSWYSPSTTSIMRRWSAPVWSALSRASQSLPQITLMTFHPAPRKIPSSSWMILPLPRTGPSSRWRLQLMTHVRLSSLSRPAWPMAPSDSGS